MPFRNSSDNMSALQGLGQTLMQGQRQNAHTQLQIALAQQAAARQANLDAQRMRHDALQAGMWEAQAARAKTQSALDAAKQQEIDNHQALINEYGMTAASEVGVGDPSMEFMDVSARLAASGQAPNAPKNIAQMRALGNPRLAAMLALGDNNRPVPAGATQPDPVTGEPVWTAPFAPGHVVGAEGSLINALANVLKLQQVNDGIAPQVGRAGATEEDVRNYNAVRQILQSRVTGMGTNGANSAAQGQPTPLIRHRLPQSQGPSLQELQMLLQRSIEPPVGEGTVLAPPGDTGAAPTAEGGLSPAAQAALSRALSGQGGPWTQRQGTNSVPGQTQSVSPGMTEYIFDEATGKIVPVNRPLER